MTNIQSGKQDHVEWKLTNLRIFYCGGFCDYYVIKNIPIYSS